MADDKSIEVIDDPAEHRYEIRVDGQLGGFVTYEAHPSRVALVHTEIDPSFEGQGLGGRLARGALDDLRAKGVAVTPLCPFIAGYIKRNPSYADLVDAAHRSLVEP